MASLDASQLEYSSTPNISLTKNPFDKRNAPHSLPMSGGSRNETGTVAVSHQINLVGNYMQNVRRIISSSNDIQDAFIFLAHIFKSTTVTRRTAIVECNHVASTFCHHLDIRLPRWITLRVKATMHINQHGGRMAGCIFRFPMVGRD